MLCPFGYFTPPAKSPMELLILIDDYYIEKIDWTSLRCIKGSYWTEMDNLGNEKPKYQLPSYIGYAPAKTIGIARFDEDFGPDDQSPDALDDDEDPYSWEADFYVSGAIAGFKWLDGSSVEKRRQFWNWYLEQAVPRAYLELLIKGGDSNTPFSPVSPHAHRPLAHQYPPNNAGLSAHANERSSAPLGPRH